MRKGVLPIILFFFPIIIFSLEVDFNELKSQEIRPIEYVNFTGEHAFFNTAEEIFGIGRELEIHRRIDGKEGTFRNRYSILRVLPQTENGYRGADIIHFHSDAQVDHIDNIRRILTGYLMEAFDYDRMQAFELAEIITVYNTILRGRMDYFANRYISEVSRYLDAGSVGLSRFFSDWAGSTSIVIPIVYSGPAAPAQTAPAPAERFETAVSPAASEPSAPAAAEESVDPSRPAVPSRPPVSTAPPDVSSPADPSVAPDPSTAGVPGEVLVPEEGLAHEEPSDAEAEKPVLRIDIEEVEEVARSEEEPPKIEAPVAEPERVIRDDSQVGRYLIYGIVILLLLFLLFILLRGLARKQSELKAGGMAYISPGKEIEKIPSAKAISAMEKPVVMQMIYHDYPLSRKSIRSVPSGTVKSVGGRGAYFSVPVLNIPKRVAEIENDGRHFVFIPHEKEYLPGIDRPISDFFGKEILLVSREGEKAVLVFREYVSPLEEINRIMHSIDQNKEPEKKESDEKSDS